MTTCARSSSWPLPSSAALMTPLARLPARRSTVALELLPVAKVASPLRLALLLPLAWRALRLPAGKVAPSLPVAWRAKPEMPAKSPADRAARRASPGA